MSLQYLLKFSASQEHDKYLLYAFVAYHRTDNPVITGGCRASNM